MTNPARRIVIIGGPKTGKTTLSLALLLTAAPGDPLESVPRVRHTDDTKDMEWSKASELVATWFDVPGSWVVEGVATGRALRKWLAAHKGDAIKPCDEVRILTKTFSELGKGQATMAKGVATVTKEIEAELVKRGVAVTHEWPELPIDAIEIARAEAAKLSRVDERPIAITIGEGASHTIHDETAAIDLSKMDAARAAAEGPGHTHTIMDGQPGVPGLFPADAGELVIPAGGPVVPNELAIGAPGVTIPDHGLRMLTEDPRAAAMGGTPIAATELRAFDPVAESQAYADRLDLIVKTLGLGRKSDTIPGIMQTIADIEAKDPATLSIHELAAVKAAKEAAERESSEVKTSAAEEVSVPGDPVRKRARQWWKDRPWRSGPNGTTKA